jgi:NADPH:quinone reductase-like Zn-dependent oxidoreductase
MKAVVFHEHGPPDVLRYEDHPDPVPAKDGVVIDIEYCGVNHLDIWTRMGIAGKTIKLPHICGCDIVGTVNRSVPGLKAGERVMIYPGISCGLCVHCRAGNENLCNQFAILGGMSDYNGGYAEQVTVPARNVVKLGKIKSETAATLAVSYLVAWNMLKTNGAGKGKSLLVYGATSGVGMATIQLAKGLGVSKIIATVSGADKAAFAKRIGAHHVIDRSQTDIAAQVMKLTGGVDIVVDHVGAATWQASIASLKAGGRMAVCGMTSGNNAVVPVRMFYSKQITMTGALLGTKRQLTDLARFMDAKKIRPVLDSIFPLEQAHDAHERMEQGRHAGKILLAC